MPQDSELTKYCLCTILVSETLNLVITAPSSASSPWSDGPLIFYPGSDLRLNCQPNHAEEDLTYSWIFKSENETRLLTNTPVYQAKTTFAHEGQYICIVRSAFGEARLSVTVKVEEPGEPPSDPDQQVAQETYLGISLSVVASVFFVALLSAYIYYKKRVSRIPQVAPQSFTDINMITTRAEEQADEPETAESSGPSYREYISSYRCAPLG